MVGECLIGTYVVRHSDTESMPRIASYQNRLKEENDEHEPQIYDTMVYEAIMKSQ